MIRYKAKCGLCRKNMAIVNSPRQFPVCKDCQMKDFKKPIKDSFFKKLFDIDPKLYEENDFLRSIKSNYLHYENLTDKQIEAFKRVVEETKNPELKTKRLAEKESKKSEKAASKNKFYSFSVEDIDGNNFPIKQLKGKVLLIVNVASKCGHTPQYSGLQKLYEKYNGQGFIVLGFPANNFANEEPGSNEEIKEFCKANYKVTFPMFAKIDVTGAKKHHLYRYLTMNCELPEKNGPITWNFEKILVNRQGLIVNRFSPDTEPEKLQAEIEKVLKL